jgi:hypothetical protein
MYVNRYRENESMVKAKNITDKRKERKEKRKYRSMNTSGVYFSSKY